jgi:hypothetical protein
LHVVKQEDVVPSQASPPAHWAELVQQVGPEAAQQTAFSHLRPSAQFP